MTPAAAPATPGTDDHDEAERLLASRIIDALLRENYGGLASRVTRHARETVLDLPAGDWSPRRHRGPGQAGRGCFLLLEPDGFIADFRLLRTAAGCPAAPLTLDDVDALIAAVSDSLDRDGAAAFAVESRQALAAIRLRQRHQAVTRERLAQAWRAAPNPRSGPRAQLGYEALAALQPHPAYPTAASRLGFSDEDSLRYAPEFAPEFPLCWLAVPRDRLTLAGHPAPLPSGWPTMPDVGLPEALMATHHLLPVHPLTARDQLPRVLAEAGLPDPSTETARSDGLPQAVVAPGTALRVIPTLSTRTVALAGDPATHLKLPLPTSTLGLLNRRALTPGTLADGALVQGILTMAGRGDPLLRALLLADESCYAHAGHPFLGYLLRRFPAGLDAHRIVPIAALLAPAPAPDALSSAAHRSGVPSSDPPRAAAASAGDLPLVIEELADWAWDGDLLGLFAGYLRRLFSIQVRLFAKYGIALESHQQNAALVLEGPAADRRRAEGQADRLRLLVKDFDGALIHFPRLTEALGADTPEESAFADPRLLTTSDDALADVFITITVHLCAGALAFGLADCGLASLEDLLALVRHELTAALDRQAAWPATSLLRARVLDADRLPGKAMLTAGTLVAKSRTGASDINKFYGTNGPNYLKDVPMRSCR